MIISVEEFKRFVPTAMEDSVLEVKLQALELLVRKYTNNNFQNRNVRFSGNVESGVIYGTVPYGLKVGDTIELSDTAINAGVYTIKSIGEYQIEVNEELYNENYVLVTKVEYPLDVKQGVVDLLKWKLENGEKANVQSETISRYSVTYFQTNETNTDMGYPVSLLGFMRPYRKVRC